MHIDGFFLSFGYERLKADMKISAFNLSTHFSCLGISAIMKYQKMKEDVNIEISPNTRLFIFVR